MRVNYFISAFILGFFVAIPPGSVTVIACQRAFQYGFRNSLVFTLGSSLSDIFYLCLVYFGLANFIHTDGNRFTLLLLCGLLLVLIGVATMASAKEGAGTGTEGTAKLQSRPWVTFISGIVVTLTNPITIIGWIAMAGNFFILWKSRVPVSTGWAVITITVIMAGVLAWFIPMIYTVSRLHRVMSRTFQKYLIAFAGLCLVIFGIVSLYSAYSIYRV